MRVIFSQLNLATRQLSIDVGEKNYKLRIELLESLTNYLCEGSFTNYKNATEYIKHFITVTDIIGAKKLKCQEANYRRIKSRLSSDAFSELGYTIIDDILNGDLKKLIEVKKTIDIIGLGLKSTDILPDIIHERIKNSVTDSNNEYTITDCVPELQFIYWYSNSTISRIMENLDKDRLAFLLKLIDNKINDTQSRVSVLNSLKADIPTKHTFPPKRK